MSTRPGPGWAGRPRTECGRDGNRGGAGGVGWRVTLLWVLTPPGLACLLVALAAVERFAPRRRGRGPASAAGIDALAAVFVPGTEVLRAQRQTERMLRDETGDGAPPARPVEVDLERGVVLVRPPGR